MFLVDFSKAIDKVSHQLLAIKLQHYGVRGNLLVWIRSFLAGRSQRVLVEGQTSGPAPVTSGVPLGSVLGPLLLLYINDMPQKVDSIIRLFADETLLYRKIQTLHDSQTLQDDLDELQQWEKEWKMSLNPSKCEVIKITRKRNTIAATYAIHCNNLTLVKAEKYL